MYKQDPAIVILNGIINIDNVTLTYTYNTPFATLKKITKIVCRLHA